MENCLQCFKELIHVPGRKQKSFCNVNCRNKYFYAKRKGEIALAKATLQSLPADYVDVKKVAVLTKDGEINPVFPKPHKKPKSAKSEESIAPIEFITIPPAAAYDAPPLPENINDEVFPIRQINNGEILKQIASIEAEKIPKERDTPNGRKSWNFDQQKRIKELKNKLK